MHPRLAALLALVALTPVAGCKGRPTRSPELNSTIKSITAARHFTTVLFNDGHVRTVGNPFKSFDDRVFTVDFGNEVKVTEVAAGTTHACGLLDSGSVRCFGRSYYGALGYGDRRPVGAPEHDVPLGGKASHIAAGHAQTCAIVDGGGVRCWGSGQGARLGYPNEDAVGLYNVFPQDVGDVPMGVDVTALDVGLAGTACAVTKASGLRCWGQSVQGSLGHGGFEQIEGKMTPSDFGDVPVQGEVQSVAVGWAHTCALMKTGTVRCWGFGGAGRLGYGNEDNIGDDTTAADAPDVDVGGKVVQVTAGTGHTCALLEGGAVRCWGYGKGGRLGYGNENTIGDDEVPSTAGDVPLGGKAVMIATGTIHNCAVMESGELRCWGRGIGDDETPASVPPVDLASARPLRAPASF